MNLSNGDADMEWLTDIRYRIEDRLYNFRSWWVEFKGNRRWWYWCTCPCCNGNYEWVEPITDEGQGPTEYCGYCQYSGEGYVTLVAWVRWRWFIG